MKEVLRLEMAMKQKDDGAIIKFKCGLNEVIEEVLNDEESEKINDLIGEINQIIVGAIRRDIESKAINEILNNKPEELYEKLSDEDKKRADRFEKELEKCKTFEEAILLAIRHIKDATK